MKKNIYFFGNGKAEGSKAMKDVLGGKGAGLVEMSRLKLPVPPGFTISSEVCNEYYENNRTLPDYITAEIRKAVSNLEEERKFGDSDKPLFLSVRSGSRSSMPGMMDTILNLGMNDKTVEAHSDKRFAYDSYRRFIQMYGNVVLKLKEDIFEKIIEGVKYENKITEDSELKEEFLIGISYKFKEVITAQSKNFTQDVYEQLENAIESVFDSWMSNRAISYRKINNIPESYGTAVTVQSMVFGNLNESSGSGVAFTRNPSTGEREFFGEYLLNAQGEDVVSGMRTPKQISGNMDKDLPGAHEELMNLGNKLEKHYRDVQDIEFTIQDGKLWLLQTRSAKRTAKAAIKIALNLISEKIITKEEAIMRVDPISLQQLIHPVLDEKGDWKVIAQGLPAAPGAVSGVVVFTPDEAVEKAKNKQEVILVRSETSPEDIEGMNSAIGILTTCGGMTSHAAVVSRGMGKVCICAAEGISIDYDSKSFTTRDGQVITAGDFITLDGNTGKVIIGQAVTRNFVLFAEFYQFMDMAREFAKIKVRANADNEQDVKNAQLFQADGIGLCRTEHMFFSSDKINLVRKMIIAETLSDRILVLQELEKVQTEDFINFFTRIGGLPVTIRLLDPPLHEFLPHDEKSIRQLSENIGLPYSFVSQRISQLKETNPMLGHRGCRLGISHPEIYQMQARAIFAAASLVEGVNLEIMVPFVMNEKDFKMVKELIEKTAKDYSVKYSIGNMIELPSAALNASKIAAYSDFFSFGTNDLTQMTLGLSRDDSGPIIGPYCENNILNVDPFTSLQKEDVGELMKIAVERGKAVNKDLKLGICGEHGGDPDTVHFCANLGLDYVSCSPYRIPIARLAAAQSALKSKKTTK